MHIIDVWIQWLCNMVDLAAVRETNRREDKDHRWEAVSDLDSIISEYIWENGNLTIFEEKVMS